MIDTHAHLTDPRYASDLPEVLGRAAEAGVEVMINPSTSHIDAVLVDELSNK